MRWLVGDLQGCVEPFERLLAEIRFDENRDEGNHDVNALLAAAGLRKRKHDTLDDLFAAPDRDALLASMRAMPVLGG